MVSDFQVGELERRAEAACAGRPARLAAVRRRISEFHREKLWPFPREGHCTVLQVLGWPEGGAPRLLPREKTGSDD